MRRLALDCSSCGKPVIFKYLVPLHKEQSKLLITEAPLDSYSYTCPRCSKKSIYNKDYVREVWIERNPDKKWAVKL